MPDDVDTVNLLSFNGTPCQGVCMPGSMFDLEHRDRELLEQPLHLVCMHKV